MLNVHHIYRYIYIIICYIKWEELKCKSQPNIKKRDGKEATQKTNSSIYPVIWKCDFLHFILIDILDWEEEQVITGKTKSTEHIIYPFIWKCDLFHSYWYPGLRRATCDYWGSDNINRTPCFNRKLTKNYHWHILPLKSYISLLWHISLHMWMHNILHTFIKFG